jgi:membrane protease YdiL (CAAX protease family)
LLVMIVTGSMNALGLKLKNNEFQTLLFQKLHQNTALLAWSLYSVSLLTGIFEEWYFRGILLKNYIGLGQGQTGLFITSILFGLAHYSPESSIIIPFLMVMIGYIFGYIYKLTGNIWINISAHVFYNGFGLLVAFFFGDKLI